MVLLGLVKKIGRFYQRTRKLTEGLKNEAQRRGFCVVIQLYSILFEKSNRQKTMRNTIHGPYSVKMVPHHKFVEPWDEARRGES